MTVAQTSSIVYHSAIGYNEVNKSTREGYRLGSQMGVGADTLRIPLPLGLAYFFI